MRQQPVHHKYPLPPGTGPLTAWRAFGYVEPRAQGYDPAARLILVVSASDIDREGRSARWEFFFDLPNRQARAIFQVGLYIDEGAIEPDLLVEQIRPFPAPDKRAARRAALPIPFRDSSEAVRDLAGQGVDFIAGDTSMTLTGEVLPTGEAVWRIFAYDVEYRTPFRLLTP